MASSGGVRDLLAFQISSWYPAFARVTFKTVILPLPPAVTDWLVSDGLHLAPDSQAVSTEVLRVVCMQCARGAPSPPAVAAAAVAASGCRRCRLCLPMGSPPACL